MPESAIEATPNVWGWEDREAPECFRKQHVPGHLLPVHLLIRTFSTKSSQPSRWPGQAPGLCDNTQNNILLIHDLFLATSSLNGPSQCMHFISDSILIFYHYWLSSKESTCQCRRCRFDPWLGKIPWRRKWQPTPAFLPEKSHGQRSLVGYSPRGCKELGMTEQLSTHCYFFFTLLFKNDWLSLDPSTMQVLRRA